MRTSVYKLLAVLSLALFVGTVVYAGTSDNLSGYGWAGQKDAGNNTVGIGWVSFNSTNEPSPANNYGLFLENATNGGELSGYTWSPNIGWLKFDTSLSCPSGDVPGCTAGARADWAQPNSDGTINLKGWARACSAFVSGCSGTLADNAVRGDWDGWVALSNPSGANWSGTNSPRFNPTTGVFSGHAWGDKVVGWLGFTGVKVIVQETPILCPDGSVAPNGDTGQCDACPNDTGVQTSITQCTADACPFMNGHQTSTSQCPGGTDPDPIQCDNPREIDTNGDCTCPTGTWNPSTSTCVVTPVGPGGPTPVCKNLTGYSDPINNLPPADMTVDGNNNCRCITQGQVPKKLQTGWQCVSPYYQEN